MWERSDDEARPLKRIINYKQGAIRRTEKISLTSLTSHLDIIVNMHVNNFAVNSDEEYLIGMLAVIKNQERNLCDYSRLTICTIDCVLDSCFDCVSTYTSNLDTINNMLLIILM